MSKTKRFEHRFVTSTPRELEFGILYVSMEFATAVHRCACGCGSKIVTPFSPTDWSIGYDGRSISIAPSIGNWSLRCRSHYFIRKGQVQWVGGLSEEQVTKNRRHDQMRKRPVERSKPIIEIVSSDKPTDTSWFNCLWHWMTTKWW